MLNESTNHPAYRADALTPYSIVRSPFTRQPALLIEVRAPEYTGASIRLKNPDGSVHHIDLVSTSYKVEVLVDATDVMTRLWRDVLSVKTEGTVNAMDVPPGECVTVTGLGRVFNED